MIKAGAAGAFLHGCVTWTPHKTPYTQLHTAQHTLLRHCLGWYRRNRTDHILSYRETPARTGSEDIEATVRSRRLHCAAFAARMSFGRISKHFMFGQLVVAKG